MQLFRPWLVVWVAAVTVSGAWAQGLRVENAWVRATVAGQGATAAFMTLSAHSAMRLVGASTPQAGIVEVHEMRMQDGVMHMAPLSGGLSLPAGQTVVLKPGGLHLMLLDLRQPVKVGDHVVLTLNLRDVQDKPVQHTVNAPVKPLGASSAAPAH